jgi:hypothetical protein
LGLALSEKQIPQVVVNVANSKHRMERLEWLGVLAKQVLSQLSYTPTVRVTFIVKHFRGFQNPFSRILGQWSEPLDRDSSVLDPLRERSSKWSEKRVSNTAGSFSSIQLNE